MQAIILAAGKGTRMQPLTRSTPKALVYYNKLTLIEHVIIRLKKHGIENIVINLHYLGEKIKNKLGNGHQLGVSIKYSPEDILLDTGGGIVQALNNKLLEPQPFIVTSTDVITDFNFNDLFNKLSKLAHLVLVPNPVYNPTGDFSILNDTLQALNSDINLNFTYANIGIFDPKFFLNPPKQVIPLLFFINRAIQQQQITAELYSGLWQNIGTTQQLEQLNATTNN